MKSKSTKLDYEKLKDIPNDIKRIISDLYEKKIFCENFLISEIFFEKYKRYLVPKNTILKPKKVNPYYHSKNSTTIKDPVTIQYYNFSRELSKKIDKIDTTKEAKEIKKVIHILNFLFQTSIEIQKYWKKNTLDVSDWIDYLTEDEEDKVIDEKFSDNLICKWQDYQEYVEDGKYYKWWLP